MLKYLFILLSVFSIHAHAAPIRIASDIWCPYACDTNTGYVVELTRRAFEIQNQPVEFMIAPFKRVMLELQRNNVDAVIGLSKKAIGNYQLLSNDVIVGYKSNDFYTLVDSTESFEQISDLNNTQQVAVVTGYQYGKELDTWLNSHPSTYFASGNDPIAMNIIRLIKGRHSVIIDNKNVIEYTASQLNLNQQLRYAGTIGKPVPLYIGFNPQNKAYVSTFDRGIQMLKANGEYKQIMDKYKILPEVTSADARYKNLQKFLPILD